MQKFFPSHNFYFFTIQLVAILILLSSFSIEIIFKEFPCSLCIMQRICWLLILLSLLLKKSHSLVLLIILVNLGIALYQSAIQHGFIPYTCPISLTVFIPPCDAVNFTIFKASLAEVNAIISFILVIFTLLSFKRKKGL